MKYRVPRTSLGYTIGLILFFTVLGWFAHDYVTQPIPYNPVVAPQATETEQQANIESNDSQSPPILDAGFTRFVSTTLEARCPYYKPDGASYRECLSAWEQELGDKLRIEELDEVHAYCSTFTSAHADETSLEGMELFLKCSIYKLQD